MPFNKGFEKAIGNIIVIQNPECIHVGDILSNTISEINNNNYISYSCYSILQDKTDIITEAIKNNNLDLRGAINTLQEIRGTSNEGWYNHPHFRPCYYHFCSAITKDNLDKLGGFDERYKNGYAFDDDEFLFRVKKIGLSVKIIPPNSCFCVHQYHRSTMFMRKSRLWIKNKDIFNRITRRLTIRNINTKGK
jgi:hypothetical protein